MQGEYGFQAGKQAVIIAQLAEEEMSADLAGQGSAVFVNLSLP